MALARRVHPVHRDRPARRHSRVSSTADAVEATAGQVRAVRMGGPGYAVVMGAQEVFLNS